MTSKLSPTFTVVGAETVKTVGSPSGALTVNLVSLSAVAEIPPMQEHPATMDNVSKIPINLVFNFKKITSLKNLTLFNIRYGQHTVCDLKHDLHISEEEAVHSVTVFFIGGARVFRKQFFQRFDFIGRYGFP